MRSQAWKLLAAALMLYLLSGTRVVQPGEVVVVTRLGAVERVLTPGLGLSLPWPLERSHFIQVDEVRSLEPVQGRMLTGDTNLVDVELVAQYTISDPVAWWTGSQDPESLLSPMLSAVAAERISTQEVDALLTTGRGTLQSEVLQELQRILDPLQLGIRLEDVDVKELTPPPAVVDAFNDVSSARGDRETLSLAADAYASRVIPDARGLSAQTLEAARAESSRSIAAAQGQLSRVQSLQSAWSTDAASTRSWLRRDTLQALELSMLRVPPDSELTFPLDAESTP